jgi:hypothetical protein|nr:MAG TPA: hypothetical protein [Caudoviricetes sp.]
MALIVLIEVKLDVNRNFETSVKRGCQMSTWVKNMFIDVPYTQATLLNMYKVVQGALEKKRTQSGVGSVQSVASKYGRPVR